MLMEAQVMHTSDSVRKVAKNIVMAYAHHIKERIDNGDERYIHLGVDSNFEDYEALFKQVASKSLGRVTPEPNSFNELVNQECLKVIQETIKMKGYARFLKNGILAESTYQVCLFILNKVREEEFDYIQ